MSPRPAGPEPPEREWVSFDDPEEDRTWVFDVTFLLSRWSCIFGRGCQGVLTAPAPELVQGCCSYGAYFTGQDDVDRVEVAAATMSAEQWQFRAQGRHRGVVKSTRAGDRVTRMVQGACIFLNRPEFPGGAGCALHRTALERGVHPMELKPDVCWQLPLRREDTEDAGGHVTSTVTQWDRRHWGAGGTDFHWWCTEAPEAFGGGEPVFRAMGRELVEMVGPDVYERLAADLERRLRARTFLPHPAVRRRPRGPGEGGRPSAGA